MTYFENQREHESELAETILPNIEGMFIYNLYLELMHDNISISIYRGSERCAV